MKHTLKFALTVAIFAIVLSGCFCDHQWLAATCTDPEICAECDKTQGEALGHLWQAATCTEPETCAQCGETRGEALGHTPTDATCTEPAVCAVCASQLTDALGHDWTTPTCVDGSICARCGEPGEAALGHSWQEATCAAPSTCSVCAATQGEPLAHTWTKATCLVPKTCSVCAATEGTTADHNWKAATCTKAKACKTCGKTEGTPADHTWTDATCAKPRTCGGCGMTEGSALGHSWQEADCDSARTCARCGKTEGSALGHTWSGESDGSTKTCSVCQSAVTVKYIAITFDDGPSGKITRKLLTGLAQRGAKATFFVCGYRVKTYSALPQEILNYGHELALHTESHAYLTKLSEAEIRAELQKNLDRLPEGSNVTLMRPPGGLYNDTVKKVCAEMGLSIIMWSLDPQDWATNSAETVEQRILKGASQGDIILLHDMSYSSVDGALAAIDKLQAQGYEFVTVSQLAALRGKTLTPGEVYTGL